MTEKEIDNVDEYMISCKWFIAAKKLAYARDKSHLTSKSFNDHAAKSLVWVHDEFVALMPLEVWDEFVEFLQQHDKRSWNSWTKLWCYIYFNASKHKGCSFSHSREQFQRELGMQGASVSSKIKELEDAGFLQRTNYNADQGIARSYVLPQRLWCANRTETNEFLY